MVRTAAGAAVLLAAGWLAAAPVRPTDPLLIGTRWTGTLTQAGAFPGVGMGPPAFRTELEITGRSGAEFVAELREATDSLAITYVVKGEVVRAADGKGYAVAFRSVDAKDVRNTSPLVGIPYAGRVSGRTLAGTWRYHTGGAAITGGFTLELAK